MKKFILPLLVGVFLAIGLSTAAVANEGGEGGGEGDGCVHYSHDILVDNVGDQYVQITYWNECTGDWWIKIYYP